MVRKPRFEYPGGIYHLIQRGNNKEFIFKEMEDKEYILELIKKYREIMEFDLYGYKKSYGASYTTYQLIH